MYNVYIGPVYDSVHIYNLHVYTTPVINLWSGERGVKFDLWSQQPGEVDR